MDATLMMITLVSLITTATVLVYAARLLRSERERSEARVAALAEQIRAAQHEGAQPAPAIARTVRRADPARSTGAMAPPVAGARASTPPTIAGTLFDAQAAPAGEQTRRWAVPLIGATVVAIGVLAVYAGSTIGRSGSAAPSIAAAAGGAQPLELVSLKHSRTDAALTISGVVRNPGGAGVRRDVAVAVFLFDRTGSFLTSGRAPVDYQLLPPGEESPFVVTIPNAGDVGRYRVSFRAGDDVVPHLDRRDGAADAGNAGGGRPN